MLEDLQIIKYVSLASTQDEAKKLLKEKSYHANDKLRSIKEKLEICKKTNLKTKKTVLPNKIATTFK